MRPRTVSHGRFWREGNGVSSIEFALIVPVLLLILAGIVDLGGALKAKFDLNSAVSAASNFTLLNADSVTSDKGADLAVKIAAIVKSGLSGNEGEVAVVINDGPTLTFTGGETKTATTSGKADKCYCPTRTGNAISYGNAVSCATACPAGGRSGKFVTIRASKPYAPLFGGFGIVQADNIAVLSVVQPK